MFSWGMQAQLMHADANVLFDAITSDLTMLQEDKEMCKHSMSIWRASVALPVQGAIIDMGQHCIIDWAWVIEVV